MDNNTSFTINPKLYDFLKWVALVVLPALAALVIGLGLTLHWAEAVDVAGVVTLVDTFLGAVLGKSSANYKTQNTLGDLIVSQNEDGTAGGLKIVAEQETPVFKAGGTALLNIKREPPPQ